MEYGPFCPACESPSGHPEVERVGPYTLRLCGTCDLVFSWPRHSPGASWYDEAYRIRHFSMDDRVRDYHRWALAHIREEATRRGLARPRILDVGCGEGVFAQEARRRGFEAWGIDVSPCAIDVGTRFAANPWIRVGTLESLAEAGLPLEYDFIVCFELLEHLEDPRGFVELCRARLRPGGSLALSVPFRSRWPVSEFNDYPPHHLTRWSTQAMRRLLTTAGLEILYLRPTSRLRSLNIFCGYLTRVAVYRLLGRYARGLDGRPSPPEAEARHDRLRRLLIRLKPRQVRDLLMWLPTLLLSPALIWFFRGYNLLAFARRADGSWTPSPSR